MTLPGARPRTLIPRLVACIFGGAMLTAGTAVGLGFVRAVQQEQPSFVAVAAASTTGDQVDAWTVRLDRWFAVTEITSSWSDPGEPPSFWGSTISDAGDPVSLLPRWAPELDPHRAERSTTDPGRHRVVAVASGWPFRALRGTRSSVRTRFGPQTSVDRTLWVHAEAAPVAQSARIFQGATPKWVPWGPIPFGFAANTAIFGIGLASVFLGPGLLRQTVRRRYGHCPSCGHDLHHVLDRPCPECGTQVTSPPGLGRSAPASSSGGSTTPSAAD